LLWKLRQLITKLQDALRRNKEGLMSPKVSTDRGQLMNKNEKHKRILDSSTPFRPGKPQFFEVLERSSQYRPKATPHFDKNSGITNATV
jgi:hypothetical protein